MLLLALDVSFVEFVEVQALSDDARRARFRLPKNCSPSVTAVKPANENSARLLVLIDCRPAISRARISPAYAPETMQGEKDDP